MFNWFGQLFHNPLIPEFLMLQSLVYRNSPGQREQVSKSICEAQKIMLNFDIGTAYRAYV